MTDEKMITYTDDEGNRIAIIGKTKVIYKKMSDVEKAIELSEMREKALHIEATEKAHARAEGRAEGERRKEAEILANLKAMGLSEEQIKQALGK
ncbi:MAG: hypothetical protein ACLU3P_07600 [[Eubacterium] siraeum]